jgi:hypothetical protein
MRLQNLPPRENGFGESHPYPMLANEWIAFAPVHHERKPAFT